MGYPGSRKPKKTPSLKTRQKRAAVTRATKKLEERAKSTPTQVLTSQRVNPRKPGGIDQRTKGRSRKRTSKEGLPSIRKIGKNLNK